VKKDPPATGQRQRRPALRQPAPQLTAPITARDGLEMIFQEAVDHIAVRRLCLIYTVWREKQRITEIFHCLARPEPGRSAPVLGRSSTGMSMGFDTIPSPFSVGACRGRDGRTPGNRLGARRFAPIVIT